MNDFIKPYQRLSNPPTRTDYLMIVGIVLITTVDIYSFIIEACKYVN